MNNTAVEQPKYGHLTSHGFWEEEKLKQQIVKENESFTNEKYHLHTDVMKIQVYVVIKLKNTK